MFRVSSSGQKPRFLPAGSNGTTHGWLTRSPGAILDGDSRPAGLGARTGPSKRPEAGFSRHQSGVTAIGWLVLLIPFAIVFYACIRLAPLYLNYMKVSRTLSELTDEYRTGGATPDSIRNSIAKHFEIDSVDYPAVKDISISRDGDGWHVEAAYDDQVPLFAHITLQVAFDKAVTLTGGD
jgi:Domain of unknown function (DUF4845)